VYVTVPRGSAGSIQTEVELPENIVAPINTGDIIGTVRAKLGVDTLASAPVFSASNIEAGSIFSTLWDELLLWFE
jgi:D-alanyl-D-alanine carboxypeptidase (penicillin-binding protein 5/6)